VNSLRAFLGFDRAVQVLLVNQLAVNTGFFVLYPYLAAHMTGALELPAWMAGLVLGFGTLSQQGLFLVGGTLSDRLGYRRVILSGLAIRALGFLLFGLANNLPLLLAAAFLSGFAGALFNPAVRAYLAEAAGPRRVEAFAFFGVFANAGLLLGPVVGAVLVGFGFTLSSTVAASVFVVLTVVQALALPARHGRSLEARPGVLADWRSVFGHRAFLLFGLPMLGYFALYVQFYLGLPLAMRRATSEESAVGLIFVISAAVGIVAQVPLTSFVKRRWSHFRTIAVGLIVMGVAFLSLLVGSSVVVVLLATTVLTLGSLLVQPFAMDVVADLSGGGGRLTGTYFGAYYLWLGIGGAAGQLLAGTGFDLARQLDLPGLPWLLLVGVGCMAALGTLAFERSHRALVSGSRGVASAHTG